SDLGLFSIPQMIVQSMSYVNMYAISPRHAALGSLGATFQHLSKFNSHPNILNKFDEMASKFKIPGLPRYKPGEWLEAYQELQKTGFGHVGGEYSMLNTQANIIRRGGSAFLEAGKAPFRWGEQNNRFGAWYIAMKEFRTQNPTGKISNADRAKILKRADFLTGNMSNASHSMFNA